MTRALYTFPFPSVTLHHEWATMPLPGPAPQHSLLHRRGLSKGHHVPPRCPRLTGSSDAGASISPGTEAPRPPPWGQTPLPCKGGGCRADWPQRLEGDMTLPAGRRWGCSPSWGLAQRHTHSGLARGCCTRRVAASTPLLDTSSLS